MVKTIKLSPLPSYIFFWMGQLVSIFGSMVVFFCLTSWLISITGSALFTTIGSLSYLIPLISVLYLGGVITDKYDRKKIILIVISLQIFSMFIMWLLFTLNYMEFWMLFFFFTLRGVCQAFQIPVVFTIIPTMVPKEHLNRINGIHYVAIGFIQMIGPLVGSRLLVYRSIRQILWVDIIAFLIFIIPLLLIKIPSAKKIGENYERESFGKQFLGGFHVLIAVQGLLVLNVIILMFDFLIQPFNTLLNPYVTIFHMGTPVIIELILISLFIGTVIGGIITAIKGTWANKTRIVLLMIVIHGITYALFALAPTGWFVLLIISSGIMGLTMPIIYAIFFTILQTSIPQEKMGRLSSIYNALSNLVIFGGLSISGVIAYYFGIGSLFFVSANIYIIASVLIFIFTGFQKLDYIKEVSES